MSNSGRPVVPPEVLIAALRTTLQVIANGHQNPRYVASITLKWFERELARNDRKIERRDEQKKAQSASAQ